ncbi:hypothetical protein GCM10028805_65260 [Spirosoma harenae]
MESTTRKYKKHKTGYKVGITYFVNQRIKPLIFDNVELFPVYVTVRVKHQVTTLKSRCDLYATKETLDRILTESPHVNRIIEAEKDSIEKSIRALRPEDDPNFRITAWSNVYELGLIPIYDIVNQELLKRLVGLLEVDLKIPTDILESYTTLIYSSNVDTASLAELFIRVIGQITTVSLDKVKALEKVFLLLRYNTAYRKNISVNYPWSHSVKIIDYHFRLWDFATGLYRIGYTDAKNRFVGEGGESLVSEFQTELNELVRGSYIYLSLTERFKDFS